MVARTAASPYSRQLAQLWWIWVVQAILAIIFGVVATFWPQLTLVTFVYLLGAFVLAIGLVETVHGLMSIGRRDTWWMTLLIGLIALGVGVYLARHPDVSFKTFILVVGITFIVRGAIDLVRSFFDPMTTSHKILGFITGLAGVAVGIIALVQPVASGLAFVWVFGLYALIYGIFSLVAAIEQRNALQTLALV